MYNHPDLIKLVNKVKPADIRDDLRQEIALSLLEKDCAQIMKLWQEDNLLKYTMRICWYMITSKTSTFHYKFKKDEIEKAVQYIKSLQELPTLPTSLAAKANRHLQTKSADINDDHEARIFAKYVELGSSRKVAQHYGIPVNHVCNIVSKIKIELKCLLQL